MSLLARNWWRSLALALVIALAWQTIRIEGLLFIPGLKADLARAERQVALEIASHRQTKTNFAQAQQQAIRLDGLRLLHVRAQQQEITDHVRQDYAQRLAAARARYDALAGSFSLRSAPTGTGDHGTAPGLSVPDLPGAAGGADAAPGAGGLSLAERWRATSQALQLEALINWVSDQVQVPVNKDPAPISSNAP